MNRRRFLGALAALLPVPAFVRASSLWLPPEKPAVVTAPAWVISDLPRLNCEAGIASLNAIFLQMYSRQVTEMLDRDMILDGIVAREDLLPSEWTSLGEGAYAIPLQLGAKA